MCCLKAMGHVGCDELEILINLSYLTTIAEIRAPQQPQQSVLQVSPMNQRCQQGRAGDVKVVFLVPCGSWVQKWKILSDLEFFVHFSWPTCNPIGHLSRIEIKIPLVASPTWVWAALERCDMILSRHGGGSGGGVVEVVARQKASRPATEEDTAEETSLLGLSAVYECRSRAQQLTSEGGRCKWGSGCRWAKFLIGP